MKDAAAQTVELNHEVLARRAQSILELIAERRAEVGLNEAITEAIERYVEAESQDDLRRFGEVIVLGRRQALLQQRLDEDREQLHHGHLNHEQLVERGHHYEMLRHDACTYNHLLRSVIETCGHWLSRDELEDWMTTASQGRREWAHAEVTGAISEIALHAALQGLPELRRLRYATLAEDLMGYDFVASWQSQLLTIDAKTGFYAPLAEHMRGHRHLEISVPREAVNGFWVTRSGILDLRAAVRRGLQDETVLEAAKPLKKPGSLTATR